MEKKTKTKNGPWEVRAGRATVGPSAENVSIARMLADLDAMEEESKQLNAQRRQEIKALRVAIRAKVREITTGQGRLPGVEG